MTPQAMQALKKANRVRLSGAKWRSEVATLERPAGKLKLASTLEAKRRPRSVDSLRVERFLTAVKLVGSTRAGLTLRQAGIHRRSGPSGNGSRSHSLRVGDLTQGERARLAGELRRQAERR